MKLLRSALGTLLLAISVLPLRAQDDTVTLPKSRLEELQRKEAELDKIKSDLLQTKNELAKARAELAQARAELSQSRNDLDKTKGDLSKAKGDLDKTKGENVQLQQHAAETAKIVQAPPPEPLHQSPPLASLPPLSNADLVDAMDLANYYRADAAAANQRFHKKSFQLRGEVLAFEKPLFIKPYTILLKTPDRNIKVVCDVQPPEKYKAVFTANDGSEIVGTLPQEKRETIARVGDTVVLRGECKGLSKSRIVMAGCELKAVKSGH